MMPNELVIKGRLWVLRERDRLFSDIDTDMIYHNAHLAVTDVASMGQFAFGNLAGYEDFAGLAAEGDIILAGDNFGSGSSRQHAVDCFRALGVRAVAARSFGAIYKRNAINSGFPIVELPGLPDGLFEHYSEAGLDLENGLLTAGEARFEGLPMSTVARDIYLAGGLFEYADRMNAGEV